MHKYQPRVHVIRKDCGDDLSPIKPVPSGEGVKAFSFPETVFTTVTAYQNQQVLFPAVLLLDSCSPYCYIQMLGIIIKHLLYMMPTVYTCVHIEITPSA